MASQESRSAYEAWYKYEEARGHFDDNTRAKASYSYEDYKGSEEYRRYILAKTREFFEQNPSEYVDLKRMVDAVMSALEFASDDKGLIRSLQGDIVMAMHELYSFGVVRWTGDRRIYLNPEYKNQNSD